MEAVQPPTANPLPLKDRYSKALLAIKNDVTQEDRSECAREVNRSKRTINEYVNGHVYDISIAQKVLTFLKTQVDKRAASI